jgi:hypothetical protein
VLPGQDAGAQPGGAWLKPPRQGRAAARGAAWRGQHGDYPSDLAQAGLDEEALRRDAHVWYVNRDGQHHVLYRAVFSVYDSDGYDLDQGRWFHGAE